MEIILIGKSEKDLKEWQRSGNEQVLKRIRKLLENIQKSPFTGIDKLEPLRFGLAGKWSMRITEKDRLVYAIGDGVLKIYSLKGHYQ